MQSCRMKSWIEPYFSLGEPKKDAQRCFQQAMTSSIHGDDNDEYKDNQHLYLKLHCMTFSSSNDIFMCSETTKFNWEVELQAKHDAEQHDEVQQEIAHTTYTLDNPSKEIMTHQRSRIHDQPNHVSHDLIPKLPTMKCAASKMHTKRPLRRRNKTKLSDAQTEINQADADNEDNLIILTGHAVPRTRVIPFYKRCFYCLQYDNDMKPLRDAWQCSRCRQFWYKRGIEYAIARYIFQLTHEEMIPMTCSLRTMDGPHPLTCKLPSLAKTTAKTSEKRMKLLGYNEPDILNLIQKNSTFIQSIKHCYSDNTTIMPSSQSSTITSPISSSHIHSNGEMVSFATNENQDGTTSDVLEAMKHIETEIEHRAVGDGPLPNNPNRHCFRGYYTVATLAGNARTIHKGLRLLMLTQVQSRRRIAKWLTQHYYPQEQQQQEQYEKQQNLSQHNDFSQSTHVHTLQDGRKDEYGRDANHHIDNDHHYANNGHDLDTNHDNNHHVNGVDIESRVNMEYDQPYHPSSNNHDPIDNIDPMSSTVHETTSSAPTSHVMDTQESCSLRQLNDPSLMINATQHDISLPSNTTSHPPVTETVYNWDLE